MNREIQCPICRHRQGVAPHHFIDYKTTHPLFSSCKMVLCDGCNSAWVLDPPSPTTLKAYYNGGVYGNDKIRWSLNRSVLTLERCQSLARWNFILDSLKGSKKDFFSQKICVCDIGAGHGCTYEVGRHKGLDIRYFAYESSPSMRKRIKSLGGEVLDDFFSYDIQQRFDVVWVSHILEHYPHPDIFLQKVKQVMKPGAVSFVEVPHLDYQFKTDLVSHLLFFSIGGLKAAIERNGFRILRIDSVGSPYSKARDEYQMLSDRLSFKRKVKERLPEPLVNLLRYAKGFFNLSFLKPQTDVSKDLQNRAIFERWQLEAYGGERCWIRATFVS